MSDQGIKHVPSLLRQFRPHAGLLDELEEYSEAYVLGPPSSIVAGIADACRPLLQSHDPQEFAVELERLARDGTAEALLDKLAREARAEPRDTLTDSTWPLVFEALRKVLPGDLAADRFLEGLTLLSLRARFAARLVRRRMGLSDQYPATYFYAYKGGLHLIPRSKISVNKKRSLHCPAAALRDMQEWAFSLVESHSQFADVKDELPDIRAEETKG